MCLLKGDQALDFTYNEVFENFVKRCPQWKPDFAYNDKYAYVIDTYKHLPKMKVVRIQTTKICSVHAYLVLVHLENCIRYNNPNLEVTMPDLCDLMCQLFEKDGDRKKFVQSYISGNLQNSTTNFLSSVYGITGTQLNGYFLAPPTDTALAKRLLRDSDEILERVKFQPAIVSFTLCGGFREAGTYSFDNHPAASDTASMAESSMHTMVLLGARVERGKYWFLCLNFWLDKVFVELSAKYLAWSAGKVVFLKQGTVPLVENFLFENVRRFSGLAVETSMDLGNDDDGDEKFDEFDSGGHF